VPLSACSCGYITGNQIRFSLFALSVRWSTPDLFGDRKSGWCWVSAIASSAGFGVPMPLCGREELLEQFF